MDVRSEYETGKLLFKWDPQTDIISISCKDTIYDVKLIHSSNRNMYKVVGKHRKPSARDAPRESSSKEG